MSVLGKLEKKLEEKMGPVVAKMDDVLQETKETNKILRRIELLMIEKEK